MSAERIEVTLGKDGGVKVFETIQELETWTNEERNFWFWLGSHQPRTDVMNLVWPRYNQFFSDVSAFLREANTIKNNAAAQNQIPQFQNCFAKIKGSFVQCFDTSLSPYSGTPFAKFVAELLKSEGPPVAAAVLAYRMRCPVYTNQIESFRGALLGFAFERDMFGRTSPESQALEELRLNWEKKFQLFRDSLQAETETHKRLNLEGGQLISKQDVSFKELLAKQEEALDDFVAKSKTELNNLRKTYDEDLALRAPVTYWTQKAKKHLWQSWAYAGVSAVAVWTSLWLLIPEAREMLQPPIGTVEPEKWHPEYWRMAMLITSALFCVWVVRILVRLLLSNIHLMTDANERVTMVQTYLALMRRGKLKDEERMFILQSLFRPTPTGIVKDDAVPLTLADAATKIRG